MSLFKTKKGLEMTRNETTTPVASFGPYNSGNGSTIEVAVWENEVDVDDRKVKLHSVSFSRNYRDGEEWKKTRSLRLPDIPILQYALGKAHEWILEKKG